MPTELIRCLTGECKDCSRDQKSSTSYCHFGVREMEVPAGQYCNHRKTTPDALNSSIIYIRFGPGEEASTRMVTPQQMRDYELVPGEMDLYQPRGQFRLLLAVSKDSTQIAKAEPFGAPEQ